MVDVAAQREESLEGVGDVGFHLLRRHARVERGYHDNRHINLGKQVHRHLHDSGDAHHGHDQAQHEDEVGIFDCKLRHYRFSSVVWAISGRTFSPCWYRLWPPVMTRSPCLRPLSTSASVGLWMPS